MKATLCPCTQIYGAETERTDRVKEEVEGGRDRSGSQGHEDMRRSRSVGGEEVI